MTNSHESANLHPDENTTFLEIAKQLKDIDPATQPREYYDPYPRPVPPELEQRSQNARIPLGHIAFQGDFDQKKK